MKKFLRFDPYPHWGQYMNEVMLIDPSDNFFKFDYTFTYETANKRLIRYELAFNETQLALLDKELIHWNLRASLISSLTKYIKNQDLIQILKNKIRLQQSIVHMVKKRLDYGLVTKLIMCEKKLNLILYKRN